MAKQILGKVVPISKGTYNSSTQYLILDIVEYNGSSYIAKQNVQGQAPTNTTYWQLLASQGDKPVYKVDYLTDAEMEEIVNDIIEDSTNAFNQNVTAKTTAFNNNATDKTNDFDSNATSKTSDFDSNASDKTTEFNTNASDKQSDFNSNASSTKDDFDRNATAKTEAYDDNASSKLSAYNDNATSKVNAYNSNASDKTTAFNNNATAKTTAFNDNYDSKIELFDEHSEELQAELDRYKTLENALPHVNGTGEYITLNDTANSPLSLELEPTELSQDSEPSPSSPQNIHVVSGDNEIKVENKNLIDIKKDTYTFGQITAIVDKEGITLNGTASGNTFIVLPLNNVVKLKSQQQYTVSAFNQIANSGLRIRINSSGSLDTILNTINSIHTFIYDESTYDDIDTNKITIRVENGTVLTNYKLNPMIEPNSVSTSYVSHQEQVVEINLGDLEYCKIGDYKDRFFKNIPEDADYDATRELGKWYLKKNIGKIVLNGSENYEFENNNRFSYRILNTQANAPIVLATVNTQSPVYSKYFNASTPNVTWSNTTNHLISLSNTINAFAITKKDVANSVEDFKTWLTTHNTIIYYPLLTTQYILLNDTLQSQLETIYNKLLSYQEQTNISQENNDLPFNIKAKAVKDLNSLIEI